MKPIEFRKAFYIKLGAGGKYERASIGHSKARIGWRDLPLEEINKRNWEVLKELRQAHGKYKPERVETRNINALRTFLESTSEDIWITFHASKLWWGKLGSSTVYEDEISRYRGLVDDWCDKNINECG